MKTTNAKLIVPIRWMLRRDLSEVVQMEAASFEFPWTEEDFLCVLRQRNCIGMVAEYQESCVGYILYELLKGSLHILNFAVDPMFRMSGVGRQMAERIVGKLSQQRRQSIILEVRESNLEAQKFFSKCGFQATGVLRGHYEDTDEDAYAFRYLLNSSDCSDPIANRLRW